MSKYYKTDKMAELKTTESNIEMESRIWKQKNIKCNKCRKLESFKIYI